MQDKKEIATYFTIQLVHIHVKFSDAPVQYRPPSPYMQINKIRHPLAWNYIIVTHQSFEFSLSQNFNVSKRALG